MQGRHTLVLVNYNTHDSLIVLVCQVIVLRAIVTESSLSILQAADFTY